MRRPQEPLSQRRLVAALRTAIDLQRPADIAALVADHPRGVASRYVQHNLGPARVRALSQVVATPLVRSLDDPGG